jgi:hypothetical protein
MYRYKLAKPKKKSRFFFPPLTINHLFLAIKKYRTLFTRCVLLFFIYLLFCLSCHLSCCAYFFSLCVRLLMKKTKSKTINSFLFVCAYSKLSHYLFPYKQPATFYFDVVVFFSLSFGKAICSFLSIFVCFCCPFQLVYEG